MTSERTYTKFSRAFRFAALLGAGFLMTGCPGPGGDPKEAAPRSSNKLVIRGSNTIGEELAPRWAAEFKKMNPDISIDMEFKGSAYGIGNLMGSYCDIAASSKPISKEQKAVAEMRDVQFKEHLIGYYAVAVIVHGENPVSNLTSNQVMGLFTGSITNWKEVGGPDVPVKVYIRDPISGTHLGFKEIAMGNGDYLPGATLHTNYHAIAQSVAQDAGALGYVGVGNLPIQGVKAVAVDSVEPSIVNVREGKYPYVRTLRFYTNARRESEEMSKFLEFVLSGKGQGILGEVGDVQVR